MDSRNHGTDIYTFGGKEFSTTPVNGFIFDYPTYAFISFIFDSMCPLSVYTNSFTSSSTNIIITYTSFIIFASITLD